MAIKNQETVERVEFRWRQHEIEFAKRLAESAEEAGRPPSDHARELMKTALTSSEELQHHICTLQNDVGQLQSQLQMLSQQLAAVEKGIRTVHDNIYQFRDEQATCVVKILADAGRMQSSAAERWLVDTLHAE